MKYGFIGTGNMAGALIKVCNDKVSSSEIALSNRTREKARKLAKQYKNKLSTNIEIAKNCHYIVLGVKPQMMKDVLGEIKEVLNERDDFVLITMAAGLKIGDYQEILNKKHPIIRIMPNTPVAVREGIILYTSENVEEEDLNEFLLDFSSAGLLLNVDEDHFDAAGTVSGCGPAFAEMMVEGLADGAVCCGLNRKQAIQLAAQMLVGSGKLVLESGRNPIELKDEVTSPGGTTIEGVLKLEEKAVPSALAQAVIASYEKNDKLRSK